MKNLILEGSLIEASQFFDMMERIDKLAKPDFNIHPGRAYLENMMEWFLSMLDLIGQKKNIGLCARIDDIAEYPKVTWIREQSVGEPLDVKFLYRIDIMGLYPSIIAYGLLNKSDEDEKAFQETAGITRKVEFGWSNLREFFLTVLYHKKTVKGLYPHLWQTTKMILNGMYGMAGKYVNITAPTMAFVNTITKKWVHKPIIHSPIWSSVSIDVDAILVMTDRRVIDIINEMNKILAWYDTPIIEPHITITHMAVDIESFTMHGLRKFDIVGKDGKTYKNIDIHG